MTERENALIALSGKTPHHVPCYFSAVSLASPYAGERLQRGVASGFDEYGVHWTVTESGGNTATPSQQAPVLTDVTKWKEQVRFPVLDEDAFRADAEAFFASVKPDREHKLLDCLCPNGMFERTHFMMGFEDTLVALYEEPEAMYDLAGAIADYKIRVAQLTAKYYKPELFTYLDDYAYIDGLFFSPDKFREIYKPHLARLVSAVQETGMIFKQHCCGKMQDLLDDFYEIGIRVFDPVQPCNDIIAMKSRYPGQICLSGGLDVQNIIDRPGVSEEEIRAEVRRCIDAYGRGGGYMMYGTTLHFFKPDAFAPGSPVQIIIDECSRYQQVNSETGQNH